MDVCVSVMWLKLRQDEMGDSSETAEIAGGSRWHADQRRWDARILLAIAVERAQPRRAAAARQNNTPNTVQGHRSSAMR